MLTFRVLPIFVKFCPPKPQQLFQRDYFRRLMGGFFSKTEEVDMAGPIASFVAKEIESADVVIFSKSYCPYCTMAKEQFTKLNKDFKTIELENREDCAEIQNVLGQMTGATSVPRVFVKGQFIGGGSDVKKLYDSGALQKMLE